MIVEEAPQQPTPIPEACPEITRDRLEEKLGAGQRTRCHNDRSGTGAVRAARGAIDVFHPINPPQGPIPGELLSVRTQTQLEMRIAAEARHEPLEAIERCASATDDPVRTVRQGSVDQSLAAALGVFGNRSPRLR